MTNLRALQREMEIKAQRLGHTTFNFVGTNILMCTRCGREGIVDENPPPFAAYMRGSLLQAVCRKF